jgi:uncharacterized membrane protein (UPF0127 family)
LTVRKLLAALGVAAALCSCRAEPAANVSQPVQNRAVASAAPAAPAAPPRTAPSGLDLVPLEIRSATGTHPFTVEVARSPDEQAQGLMFRAALAADEGMIFPFPRPRVASFWMRNTLIPLDMIFIRADGTIARIAANTVPHSEESISSGEPVAAVLEIKGGRAAELGISEGDLVAWAG